LTKGETTMITAPITAAPDVETFFRTPPADTLGGNGLEDFPALTDAEAPEGETAEAFTPDTADKVDWVLGKMADCRARAARVRENAEKIARQHEAEAEGLEWRFGAALQAFLRSEIARQELEGSRRKSLRLLNGVLGYRTKPAGVNVTDPLRPCPGRVRTCLRRLWKGWTRKP